MTLTTTNNPKPQNLDNLLRVCTLDEQLAECQQSALGNNHGGCRQPMCDPEGCATFLGVVGGGTPPPPWLTQTLGVSGSGGQPPGSPGGGGGGRWVPQHTYLKMMPMTR